jgi:SHAQKYF class myb-like DNA-binding protein
MFSDVERSPSWPSQPLPSDFGPHSYPPTALASAARPPVQSGWFPLQDSPSPSSVDPSRSTHDMYTDNNAMLPPPANRPLQNPSPWPASPVGPYVDNRPRGPYGPLDVSGVATPTTPSGYSPLYGYSGTPVASDGTSGFGWQDARPVPSPPIHTTGLEHLRVPYDDMQRVHAAAQGMHAMMGGPGGHPMTYGRYGVSPASIARRKHKEISVGRWTSEEHRVFLKGLELYQGPSWGEIARMIGTRTSTQVRTHAQKFFTKLARTNQVLPYFETQIKKERARLVTQGAVPAGPSTMITISAVDAADLSVTPTATSSQTFAFNTLSPPRKHQFPPSTGNNIHTMQRPSQSGYEDQGYGHTQPRPPMQPTPGSTMYSNGMDPASGMDMYKPRLDSPSTDFNNMQRKPIRMEYAAMDHLHPSTPSTPYGDQSMMACTPTTADAYRDPTVYGDWHDAAARPWPQSIDVTNDSVHTGDPDSLPSVTRLLYRGGPTTT